jgi:hypothetical protein
MRRRGTIRAAILIGPVIAAGGYAEMVLASALAGLRTYQETGIRGLLSGIRKLVPDPCPPTPDP